MYSKKLALPILLSATLLSACAGGQKDEAVTETDTAATTTSATTTEAETDVTFTQTTQTTLAEEASEAADTEVTQQESEKPEDSGEKKEPSEFVKNKLAQMSIEDKVSQMFALMPEAISYASPVTNGAELKEGIYEYPLGGILFMGQNINSQEQIKEMIENVQAYSADRIGLPMFTFVDEEGGSVRRVSGKVEGILALKSASEMAADGDDIYETGKWAGGYLSELGFNVDFAPVADVVSEDSSLVIEDRSFGSDPYKVADSVTAFAGGLKSEGVMATFKHFPGHGPTASDTHKDSAYIYKSVSQLKDWDLIPFQTAIDDGAEFIMVSHANVSELDADGTPATLSKAVISGLLREEMGYEGIVVTDAMNMGAIADYYTSGEAALMAVNAGADILLEPKDFQAARNAVLNAIYNGEISEKRIDESVQRILEVKEKL